MRPNVFHLFDEGQTRDDFIWVDCLITMFGCEEVKAYNYLNECIFSARKGRLTDK